MSSRCDVVVIGAGPYGLSTAAHLRSAGIDFRIFGTPMNTWCDHMPDGMILKSDGFASNLSDPESTFTLKSYCVQARISYDDTRIPIHIDTFRSYGLAFQRRFVPELEDRQVTQVARDSEHFRICLDDGEQVTAHRLVVAVGLTHFQNSPPRLAQLPQELVTHSSSHRSLDAFRGRRVTVLGAGASAIDLAVLLKESGTDVTLAARRPSLRFSGQAPAGGRSLLDEIRLPSSPIGPGWRSRFYSDAPGLFRYLPLATRQWIIVHHNAPTAGWPMKERFVGNVPTLLGYNLERADTRNGLVHLRLSNGSETIDHEAEHVIAATGYRVDLRRLPFLSKDILSCIKSAADVPLLTPHFESSIPDLYFIGAASASTFGPVMRFACGADWTARRICQTLLGSSSGIRRRIKAQEVLSS